RPTPTTVAAGRRRAARPSPRPRRRRRTASSRTRPRSPWRSRPPGCRGVPASWGEIKGLGAAARLDRSNVRSYTLTMFGRVRAVLEQVMSRFDPALVDADTAQRLLDQVVAIKHMAATAEAGLAARVADTRVWADGGDPSAAHELARRTGTSVGRAKEILETGRRLR